MHAPEEVLYGLDEDALENDSCFGFSRGFMLFGGATNTRADSWDNCHRNVENWEQKLDRDIYRHGFNSRQANHDRHELGEARESCHRRFGNDLRNHYYIDRDYDHDRR